MVDIIGVTNGVEPGTQRVVATIVDDDLPPAAGTLQFGAPAYSRAEGGGTATITVTRAGGSAGAVSVRYATADGTAGGGDYTAASGTLSWADGDASPKTFTVALLDDARFEFDETVLLALGDPSGGATLGTTATAVLTINDDDPAALGDAVAGGQPAGRGRRGGDRHRHPVRRVGAGRGRDARARRHGDERRRLHASRRDDHHPRGLACPGRSR